MASTFALPCFGRLCHAVIWPGDANAGQSSATESSRKTRIRWIQMHLNDTFFPNAWRRVPMYWVWGLRSVRLDFDLDIAVDVMCHTWKCCKTWLPKWFWKSVPQCPAVLFFHSLHSVARMYHKGTELSHESVTEQCPRWDECIVRVLSRKSVSQLFSKGVPQECLPRVSCKLQEPSFKSSVQERRTRVSVLFVFLGIPYNNY